MRSLLWKRSWNGELSQREPQKSPPYDHKAISTHRASIWSRSNCSCSSAGGTAARSYSGNTSGAAVLTATHRRSAPHPTLIQYTRLSGGASQIEVSVYPNSRGRRPQLWTCRRCQIVQAAAGCAGILTKTCRAAGTGRGATGTSRVATIPDGHIYNLSRCDALNTLASIATA